MPLEQVQAAVEALEAAGQVASANAVLAQIGGSKRDVLVYLRQLRGQRVPLVEPGGEPDPDPDLDPLEDPDETDDDPEEEDRPGRQDLLDLTAVIAARARLTAAVQAVPLCEAALARVQAVVDAVAVQVLAVEKRVAMGLLHEAAPYLADTQRAAQAWRARYSLAFQEVGLARHAVAAAEAALVQAQQDSVQRYRRAWATRHDPPLATALAEAQQAVTQAIIAGAQQPYGLAKGRLLRLEEELQGLMAQAPDVIL